LVEKIIDFGTGVSKVVLSPTQLYPIGLNYFFMDTDDVQIVVENKAWGIARDKVVGKICGDDGKWANICLSRIIFERRGIPVKGKLIHRNRVSIDNTFGNLIDMSVQDKNRSFPSRGTT